MNYIAVMQWGTSVDEDDIPDPFNRVDKYAEFDDLVKGEDHVARFSATYPNAFVVEKPSLPLVHWRVSGNAIVDRTQAEIDAVEAAEDAEKDARADRVVGRPEVGGIFALLNQTRVEMGLTPFTVADLKNEM